MAGNQTAATSGPISATAGTADDIPETVMQAPFGKRESGQPDAISELNARLANLQLTSRSKSEGEFLKDSLNLLSAGLERGIKEYITPALMHDTVYQMCTQAISNLEKRSYNEVREEGSGFEFADSRFEYDHFYKRTMDQIRKKTAPNRRLCKLLTLERTRQLQVQRVLLFKKKAQKWREQQGLTQRRGIISSYKLCRNLGSDIIK